MNFAIFNHRMRNVKPRVTLESLSDDEIFKICRMPRDAVLELHDMLYADLARSTNRSAAIPVETQILVALEFFSSGSFQWTVSQCTGLSQPSISRIISLVTEALCRHINLFIKFPTTNAELQKEKQSFHALAGIPNVVGCIDGSHILIQAPAQDVPYINRKVGC